ncbi:MAG: DUF3971 domain-containing protein [Aestuariivirga sp.]|uniref:YhdP family protein n=1 Tax=Aestuariivirga sp. TaxID=2650926 RepID=UPI0038D013BB
MLLLAAGLYMRLAQGPVPLDFMRAAVESRINQSLPNLIVKTGGVVAERSEATGIPQLRLRDVEIRDKQGNLVAKAPRAAIGVREDALFRGSLAPSAIELIGPRILVKRGIDGSLELGFGEAAPENEAVTIDVTAPPAGEAGAPKPGVGATIIEALSGAPGEAPGSISSIETIRIADARIRFYDVANDALWDVPSAELVFQRMPYGFAVAATAAISNGDEEGLWTAELSASYRRDTRSFAVSARISDLVPANISDEIFALSQLARVNVPLAGQVDMEITDTGLITKATAEFTAFAGEVDLPDYLAEPLIIDEGSLRADYDPVTGSIIITDSSLLVGSSRAQVRGSILPERNAEGKLTALRTTLEARNVAIDTQGSVNKPVTVDRVDFIGNAAIEEARLDIDDLLVMSGGAGIRLRGSITGGSESAGILLSGRVKDLSASLLKQLWPPIITPRARKWVNDNVRAGTISEGDFVIKLPVDAMAEAKRKRRLPPGSIDMSFKMKDVSSGYFRDLPPLNGASGEARLKDSDFLLNFKGGEVKLPSGGTGRVLSGSFESKDILAVESYAMIALDLEAGLQPLIEYLDLPALNLIRHTGLDTGRVEGKASAKVSLSFPMIKNVPKERIVLSAQAKLSDVGLADALPGINLSGGQFDFSVEKGILSAKGQAQVAGIPAEIGWRRGPGPEFVQSATISTKLDGEQRQKLGIDLGTLARGPVGVTATIDDLRDPQGKMAVAADLSEVELRLQSIGWRRPAAAETSASFVYLGKAEGGPRIEDLEIKGEGLSIKGKLALGPKRQGLRSANFSEIRLSGENRFAATVAVEDGGMNVSVKGASFDARPLIRGLFGSRNREEAAQAEQQASAREKPVRLSLDIGRVYANRGEIITGVNGTLSARAGKIEKAEVSGAFLSGQPIVFRVTPTGEGREMRISGRDGGAAIRAANLYSKVAGGQIEFFALLAADGTSVKNGKLVLRDFEVRDEAALAELDSRGKPKRGSGPRREALSFKKLTLPFTSDSRFICIGESLVRGPELGASAAGLIRKSDGAIDIAGTIIPAYALNAAVGDIPLLGDILTGGRGQGIIGVTFALGGTVDKPSFQMNPMSAVAPGFLRMFFEYSSRCEPLKQAPAKGNGG